MVHGKTKMVLELIVLIMSCSEAAAESSCSNVLISMSPCLDYISGNSSNPSSQCCSPLANVVRLSPQCLCEVLSGSGTSLGPNNVNQTRALGLPGACNVQTPSISHCDGRSPSGSSSGSPESPRRGPLGNGSKSLPTTQEYGSSHGSSIKLSPSLLTLISSVCSIIRFGLH